MLRERSFSGTGGGFCCWGSHSLWRLDVNFRLCCWCLSHFSLRSIWRGNEGPLPLRSGSLPAELQRYRSRLLLSSTCEFIATQFFSVYNGERISQRSVTKYSSHASRN